MQPPVLFAVSVWDLSVTSGSSRLWSARNRPAEAVA